MTIADSFLAEFEAEAVTTGEFLERLPKDKLTWKPHEKSMTAGQLALHLAASPGLLIEMAGQDECPPAGQLTGDPLCSGQEHRRRPRRTRHH